MAGNSVQLAYDGLRSLAFGGISAAYAQVGSTFVHPVRIIKVWNNTDIDLTISYDGVHDMDFVATKSGFVLDYCANKGIPGGLAETPAQQAFWVKGAGASSGSVFVTVIYAF